MSPQQLQTPVKMPTYHLFSPHVKGSLAMGVEKFSDMLDQIGPLHRMHYEETEAVYLDQPFNPDYQSYMDMEVDSRFICFTLRLGWEIVAYLQYYIFRDLHTKCVLNAREDAFFVHPSARGQKVGPTLLAYAEDALKSLGCHYVGMTSKHPVGAPDIGPFLERRGYRPVAMYYAKNLEK